MENVNDNENGKEKKSTLSIVFKIGMVILFLTGVGLLLYPAAGNVISCVKQEITIAEYERQVAKMSEKEISDQKQLAASYNKLLNQVKVKDPFGEDGTVYNKPTTREEQLDRYYKALSIGDHRMLGYIKIPKISLSVPIYHDATEFQLQRGIGHLRGTALPVGGKGTHCVLSGHTGIPGNMLFTDINKLELGDKFYLHVLDEVLAYQIDSINVVEPDHTEGLSVDPQKDYCTLVTCTPYGINSHRLLVRGIRSTYTPGEDGDGSGAGNKGGGANSEGSGNKNIWDFIVSSGILWMLIPLFILLLIVLAVVIARKMLRKKSLEEGGKETDEQG